MAAREETFNSSVDDEWIAAIRSALTTWGSAHWHDFPWRQPIPAWQALVAEVLLVRTRATQVEPVFERFCAKYPTLDAANRASAEEIFSILEPLGLRWRAELVDQLIAALADRRGSVPIDAAALEELPGVGPYTAAATLSLHHGVRAVIIDSNVVRVLSRLVGEPYDGETRRKRPMRDLAERLTPHEAFRDYNYAVLDLSMAVCVPATPHCSECPLVENCAFARLAEQSSRNVSGPTPKLSGTFPIRPE